MLSERGKKRGYRVVPFFLVTQASKVVGGGCSKLPTVVKMEDQ